MWAKRLTIAAVVVAGLAAGGWAAIVHFSESPPEVEASVLPVARELPAFDLTDHRGHTASRETLRGHWSLLFFGFSHCPGVCPATLGKLERVAGALAGDGSATMPQVYFVSVDPARDTPERLRAYLDNFGAPFIGLTGAQAELKRLAAGASISYSVPRDAAPDGDYRVQHSAVIVLVDPKARIRAFFTPPHRPERMARELKLLTTYYGS